MKSWLWLLLGAIAEVGWVAGLKLATTPLAWAATAACAAGSVALALGATRELPATTVYILFVGMGTIGSAIVEAVALDVALSPAGYVFLALLIICIIGLKMTGNNPRER